ncbi:hypothetical protein BGX29_006416 [Mortierella sp. GBA35]|nr:hypothetical protein BGX29_006416 [Mortierella sp. GBA35]
MPAKEYNPVMTAPHPVIPPSKTEINTAQTAPHPLTPTTVESNPALTAPHPVIPTTDNTTTSQHHHTTAEKAAPVLAAAAAVPVVAAHLDNNKSTTVPSSTTTTSSNPYSITPNTNITSSYSPYNTNTHHPVPTTFATPTAPIMTQHKPTVKPAEVERADKITAAIPESYHGPIPELKPGEEIVWVKTITTTDYYDDGNGNGTATAPTSATTHDSGNGGAPQPAGMMEMPPSNTVHDNSTQRHSGGFFDRLTHRHHHDNVDKGKQRM